MQTMIRRIAQHAVMFCAMRQEALDEAIKQAVGEYDYDVDTVEHRFDFLGERGRASAYVDSVMSIAMNPATMLWAWSPLLERSGGTNPASTHIRQLGEQMGIAALTTVEVPYAHDPASDQADTIAAISHDVGMLAVELCGPQTFYYSLDGGGSRLVVLLSNLTVPVPMFSIDDLLIKLPRMLGGGLIDDIAWSLDGVARLRDWRLDTTRVAPDTQQFALTDETGTQRAITVTFDEHNRPSNVQSAIGGS